MKKLLFTIAAAASFAAMADGDPNKRTEVPGDIDLIGFENFSVLTNVVDRDDYGNESANTTQWVSTTGDDESIVKSYGGDNASAPTNAVPAPFADLDPNTKYLALDTNGGELQRYLSPKVDNSYASTNVAPTGTYIDTLVQFTVTEDEAPDVTDAKLAIWMGVENGVTNLCVTGGYYWDQNGEPQAGSNRVYHLSGTYEPSTWYRLTVKAKDISTDQENVRLLGFVISIDNNVVAASEDVYDSSLSTALSAVTGADKSLLDENKFIPTMGQDFSTAPTLTSVGFKGTGAIDDLVVTEIEPSPTPSAIDFTLTWTPAEVSAVSYVLSADMATTNTLTSGTAAQIPAGTTGTIELIPTFESGYEFDYVDMGGTQLTLTFDVPTESTNAMLVAKAAAAAYPTYIDTSDATIKAKYDAWKAGVGFDDSSASSHLNQFLLNVDEATTVGETALEITEIKQNTTAGWDITIGCTVSGASLTGTVGETIVCNGYLAVSYTDDLTGTWTTENIAITAVDATAGTVTVNVNKSGAKFMKVSLTAAPQPAAQE